MVKQICHIACHWLLTMFGIRFGIGKSIPPPKSVWLSQQCTHCQKTCQQNSAVRQTSFQHRGLPSVKQKAHTLAEVCPSQSESGMILFLSGDQLAGWTPNWKWSSRESLFAFIGAVCCLPLWRPQLSRENRKIPRFCVSLFCFWDFHKDAEMEGCDWLRALFRSVQSRDTAWWGT